MRPNLSSWRWGRWAGAPGQIFEALLWARAARHAATSDAAPTRKYRLDAIAHPCSDRLMKSTNSFGKTVIAACVVGGIFAACGGSEGSGGTNGADGGQGGTSGTKSSGSGGDNQGDIGGAFAGSSGTLSGAGGAESCAGSASQAELVPLDIYMMLDSSGSMNFPTSTGATKWTAVTSALTTFFKDPNSAGLGVGIQNFPILAAGVPATCKSNADCPGTSGPCLLKQCAPTTTVIPCSQNTDCPSGSACITLGTCGTTTTPCAVGSACPGGVTCNPLASSTCFDQDSCVASDYGKPKVEISQLNVAAAPLINAMSGMKPSGATPTFPALQGAVSHASAWAKQHPTHTVIALFATDGLPTECSPTDITSIAKVASTAASGSPAIKTFVIGVFSTAEKANAQTNLDKIALAGGTPKAFIIDTTQNVQQAFLDALKAIRETKLACEYAVPTATGDAGMLDYGKVNVEYLATGATSPVTIPYVTTGVTGCDATAGGWYYDVDPATGATPTKIIMCPATCTKFGQDTGGQVDIRVGCKTIIAPPPK
jgi:hypothetical protein